MADFVRRQLEIGLEFVHGSFDKCNNFSDGSSEPMKDAHVIRVRGTAAPQVFQLELLVHQTIIQLYNVSPTWASSGTHLKTILI